MKTFQEFTTEAYAIEEGMSLKDFKANRRKLKRREASADAKKRGHVGKEWYNSGRTYSPDEAKSRRSNMDDAERQSRYRSSMEPEGDDSNYSADKTKNPKKIRKQKAMGELGKQTIDEILMVTPTTKKTATKSQSKPTRDPYGEDPAVTRKRLAAKIKKLKEEDEIEEGIGMTMANALGNPPALSKRMKLKQALIINKIKSDAKKNREKKYSGKAATTEEYVEELFVTRKSPEQRADEKRKKKVAELIRLMKYAKDPSSDVARKPVAKEEYYEEKMNEAGDWWHPDPKKDRAISGSGNKMRSREDRGQDTSLQTKPDYSKRLKPGETYMQFAKRKQSERSGK